MANNNSDLEKRLWAAADELRANSKLNSSEYSSPVLGLIFLRFADAKFAHAQAVLEKTRTGRRQIGKADYQAMGVLFLPAEARFSTLLKLPEGTNIGQAINDAMRAIEAKNRDLKDVLPKSYNRIVEYPLHEEFVAHHHFFNHIVEEVAREEGVWFVDNEALMGGKSEYFVDFVHYSVEGVARLARNYADELAARLAADGG